MFHLSRLTSGLLRLPKGKSVNNINDYRLQMIQLKSDTIDKNDQDTAVTSQTCGKSVGYHQLQQSYFIGFRHTDNVVPVSKHPAILFFEQK